jgi:hypothetical protein
MCFLAIYYWLEKGCPFQAASIIFFGTRVRRNGSTILILLLVSPKIYLATFTALFSLITVTFIWPG